MRTEAVVAIVDQLIGLVRDLPQYEPRRLNFPSDSKNFGLAEEI
jgi:hypothetical protein